MKKALVVLLALVICISSAFASYYESGDTEFSFRAGVILPAFQWFPERTEESLYKFSEIHMNTIGGYGSISYQVFTSNQIALGGEVGYNFVSSKSDKFLTVVPFTAKGTWAPVQTGKFDLNLHLNAGGALIKYNDHRFFPAPYMSFAINPVFYITDKWGIGLEAGIWGALEFYTSSNKRSSNCITSMLPALVTVTYRH